MHLDPQRVVDSSVCFEAQVVPHPSTMLKCAAPCWSLTGRFKSRSDVCASSHACDASSTQSSRKPTSGSHPGLWQTCLFWSTSISTCATHRRKMLLAFPFLTLTFLRSAMTPPPPRPVPSRPRPRPLHQASARAIVNEDPTANVPAQVMLVSRHELVVKQFDLNIEWVSEPSARDLRLYLSFRVNRFVHLASEILYYHFCRRYHGQSDPSV